MNPMKLAEEIESRYRRYLESRFYFKDPALRESFRIALASGELRKGPFLEATPVFTRGATPRQLLGHLMNQDIEAGFLQALDADRPLYRHQEEAMRRVSDGRNVIVATGTGSGKTESFLYPILLHLYREFTAATLWPGVRALVLYPMNALANDQRERLGRIGEELADANSTFRFTFGQYIGETPENENDSPRHARDHIAARLPGELVLRSEMRESPPHILLTNYSMLEYLLLRPDDSPLFDNGNAQWWSFLVLDEAHQYRGAKGIEMAMLLRRLKQRLREGGRTGEFQCIATSATLMGGDDDKPAVARFASDLFAEPFDTDDVILGEVEPIPETGEETLDIEDYRSLLDSLESGTNDDAAKAVGAKLQGDKRSAILRQLATRAPTEVNKIAYEIFGHLPVASDRIVAVSGLVALLIRSKNPETGAPLLSARYHLFLKSLEGAFVSLWPEKQILLNRESIADTALFEVGLCRECGQHYLVGKIVNGKLREAIRDPGRSDFGATFFLQADAVPEEEDGEQNQSPKCYKLCIRCGEICRDTQELRCDHGVAVRVLEQAGAREREDQIPRCAVCKYQAPDPVREVVHGTDGPHAVIATTLYQELPERRRKVLAFADGRQEAAFFAWYLENSYGDILARNVLTRVVRRQAGQSSEGSSLPDLASGLKQIFREQGLRLHSASDLELRKDAWIAVYREFLTDEPRISLEGVGLARWALRWPDWFDVPTFLQEEPWSLSLAEAHDLVATLLDTMRTDRAVELQLDAGVSVNWDDFGLQARQMRYRIGRPAGQAAVRGWDGKCARRVRLMAKLLKRIDRAVPDEDTLRNAINAVRAIWDSLQECDRRAPAAQDRILIPIDDGWRLNPNWWRLRALRDNDPIYRCNTCSRIQPFPLRGICVRAACPGNVQQTQLSDLEPNHYRQLYEAVLPGVLRVEEHTAQLASDKAREFQREFQEGKIHVLSCSTTFELGVDLGDLDTVFLRNVPPESFNYAQRVGRAGRRSGYPGFAITYCKRGPHDLSHFAEPQRMLAGKTQPPVLALCNEKIISRHMTAVALSCFFRESPSRFESVQSLLGDLLEPRCVEEFRAFLTVNREQIEDTLQRIVPVDMLALLGVEDGSWLDRIASANSRLAYAEIETSSDYRAVFDLEHESRSKRDYRTAEWARKRSETISEEKVLTFLSRKAVIPKYGFPVDVVELDTQRTQSSQEVSLQRDLKIAISEFAPTSKLVANKLEWVSYALKKVPAKEWEKRSYFRCTDHNVFVQWRTGERAPELPCDCRLRVRTYIVPQFGFATDSKKPKAPSRRPAKVFTTRPYFAGTTGPDPGTIHLPAKSPVLTIRRRSPGVMVVLCEGRRGEGFRICGNCGAGFRGNPGGRGEHKNPQGQQCRGSLETVSLGHEIETDVLQLQFHMDSGALTDILALAYSVAYAVAEGAAEALEIPSTDLNTAVGRSEAFAFPPIVLYDDVPGGAGLVARLENENVLRRALTFALNRLDGKCGCGENTSCYGCLRSYRNQFIHDSLQRGAARQYLESILHRWQ